MAPAWRARTEEPYFLVPAHRTPGITATWHVAAPGVRRTRGITAAAAAPVAAITVMPWVGPTPPFPGYRPPFVFKAALTRPYSCTQRYRGRRDIASNPYIIYSMILLTS